MTAGMSKKTEVLVQARAQEVVDVLELRQEHFTLLPQLVKAGGISGMLGRMRASSNALTNLTYIGRYSPSEYEDDQDLKYLFLSSAGKLYFCNDLPDRSGLVDVKRLDLSVMDYRQLMNFFHRIQTRRLAWRQRS